MRVQWVWSNWIIFKQYRFIDSSLESMWLWWWCYSCRVKRSSKNINNFHRSENCICFVCQFVPIEFVQAVYCVMQIYPISQFVIVDQLVILFSSSPIEKVWNDHFLGERKREMTLLFSDWSIEIRHSYK